MCINCFTICINRPCACRENISNCKTPTLPPKQEVSWAEHCTLMYSGLRLDRLRLHLQWPDYGIVRNAQLGLNLSNSVAGNENRSLSSELQHTSTQALALGYPSTLLLKHTWGHLLQHKIHLRRARDQTNVSYICGSPIKTDFCDNGWFNQIAVTHGG